MKKRLKIVGLYQRRKQLRCPFVVRDSAWQIAFSEAGIDLRTVRRIIEAEGPADDESGEFGAHWIALGELKDGRFFLLDALDGTTCPGCRPFNDGCGRSDVNVTTFDSVDAARAAVPLYADLQPWPEGR